MSTGPLKDPNEQHLSLQEHLRSLLRSGLTLPGEGEEKGWERRISSVGIGFGCAIIAYSSVAIAQAFSPSIGSGLPQVIYHHLPDLVGTIVFTLFLSAPRVALDGIQRFREGKFPLSTGAILHVGLFLSYFLVGLFVSGAYIDLLFHFLVEELVWFVLALAALSLLV